MIFRTVLILTALTIVFAKMVIKQTLTQMTVLTKPAVNGALSSQTLHIILLGTVLYKPTLITGKRFI